MVPVLDPPTNWQNTPGGSGSADPFSAKRKTKGDMIDYIMVATLELGVEDRILTQVEVDSYLQA